MVCPGRSFDCAESRRTIEGKDDDIPTADHAVYEGAYGAGFKL